MSNDLISKVLDSCHERRNNPLNRNNFLNSIIPGLQGSFKWISVTSQKYQPPVTLEVFSKVFKEYKKGLDASSNTIDNLVNILKNKGGKLISYLPDKTAIDNLKTTMNNVSKIVTSDYNYFIQKKDLNELYYVKQPDKPKEVLVNYGVNVVKDYGSGLIKMIKFIKTFPNGGDFVITYKIGLILSSFSPIINEIKAGLVELSKDAKKSGVTVAEIAEIIYGMEKRE